MSALRYCFPWNRIESEPGVYDWSSWDARAEFASKIGLELYLDIMHFGTPLWLRQAAGDPEFPEALERFTGQLVGRYQSSVKNWCPCNEPLVLALFSGDFGFWPPHSRKWRGYMPVLSRVIQATSRSIRAIRQTDSSASVILCDHVENYRTRVAALDDEVTRRNQRRYLGMDLLLGKVTHHHPLYEWLINYGFDEIDLEWFKSHPQMPDILGIDYYPNSEWQLDQTGDEEMIQRRSETPLGLYAIAKAYYRRYALPMMLTETSADGHPINREIWLELTIDDCRRLRQDGIPMHGYFWWPMIDQMDWDGALTHRVGKIHHVGIYNLERTAGGELARGATPLVAQIAKYTASNNKVVGVLQEIAIPLEDEEQKAIGSGAANEIQSRNTASRQTHKSNHNGNGRHRAATHAPQIGDWTVASDVPEQEPSRAASPRTSASPIKSTDRYGIVVFSHLRWGFVWQRPQQFLSRFAKRHNILFVEEPFFDLPKSGEPHLDFHKVMPNVTVLCPHFSPEWRRNPMLPDMLRQFTSEGIEAMNGDDEFDSPLLWYYSPMDSAWSLGYFANRGVVYDCMDELSHFTGAPAALVENESRLMRCADIVFTGGYKLGEKKMNVHANVHTFGCGVDYAHFAKAADPNTAIPPDIDFLRRPILGWFGVIDERVDYGLVAEVARMRPAWSIAMVGPVVKIDPNLLPHSPNLFWLGSRDYQQLPNYCRAFDVNMMCFAINRATEFINPTKGLEYMATGKPIVSTPVRDVVRQWSDVVRIAATADEFVRAVENALSAGPNDPFVQRGIALAKQSSWESTVQKMQSLIAHAIGSNERPSARRVEPLSDSQLEYAYAATQGS